MGRIFGDEYKAAWNIVRAYDRNNDVYKDIVRILDSHISNAQKKEEVLSIVRQNIIDVMYLSSVSVTEGANITYKDGKNYIDFKK